MLSALVLTVAVLTMAITSSVNADSALSKEELAYTAKNLGASPAKRKLALELLAKDYPETYAAIAMEIMEKPNETNVLKGYAMGLLPKVKNLFLTNDLARKVSDRYKAPETRELFLHTLWTVDPKLAMETARLIVGDLNENFSMRLRAVSYLCEEPNDPKNKTLFEQLLKNPNTAQPLKNVIASCFEMEEVKPDSKKSK